MALEKSANQISENKGWIKTGIMAFKFFKNGLVGAKIWNKNDPGGAVNGSKDTYN